MTDLPFHQIPKKQEERRASQVPSIGQLLTPHNHPNNGGQMHNWMVKTWHMFDKLMK
jgi:hypothetical protein